MRKKKLNRFRLKQIWYYIYFKDKNIAIFIPDGINSIEYLFLNEANYGINYNQLSKGTNIHSQNNPSLHECKKWSYA